MRVLIVDDEDFFRVSFKSIIKWEHFNIEEIVEAQNGKEAIEKIKEESFDLIFLDIKMPKCDGIEVLQFMKYHDIHMKVIVLSSYTEYEYVREAMKLGAIDYVHKPIMNEEMIQHLLNSILGNKQKNKGKSQSSQQEYQQSKPHTLQRLLLERDMNVSQCSDTLAFKEQKIFCYIFSIDQFQIVLSRYKTYQQYLLEQAVDNILHDFVLRENEMEYVILSENRYCIIQSFSELKSEHQMHQAQLRIINKIKDAFKLFLNVTVSVGISQIHDSYKELHDAYCEAVNAKSIKFYTKGNAIIYSHQLKGMQECRGEMVELLHTYYECMQKDQWDRCITLIESLYKEEESYKKVEDEYLLFKELYYITKNKLNELKDKNIYNEKDFFKIEEVMEKENRYELQDLFLMKLKQMKSIVTASMSTHHSKINKAIHFIQNYYRQDITLKDVADFVELNSSYLSRVFKANMGMSITHYINLCKIEKAEELLRDSNLKIYEIADEVGFIHVQYFNNVFKKFKGRSPLEYRNFNNMEKS
ncbi:response regulator transcription factor [Vallitalea okinawensis]|uniref:response regulator transcription factor n=1 Tax=Vallitalea okinawensis TaxID=2078660 RepID=UPI001478FB1A|nr:response regulator [Vallitalea okinawensis]